MYEEDEGPVRQAHEGAANPCDESGLAWEGPAIGLLDLDAFFASVEQLDHPEWRGKPVIVGGDAERRGVVSTASYEARAFGVHSAMSSAQARRLCPEAIWTQGRYDRYREMSRAVMDVIGRETPFVEQVSIDEAFFDVSPGRFSHEDPVAIARRISRRVSELGVTCSIGLSSNKTTAKIASERDKPRGLTVVPPQGVRDFLRPLPIRAMSGIGKSTEAVLESLGIRTLGQLADADRQMLADRLGVMGPALAQRAAGREHSPVRARDDREKAKSVSNERTFAQDLTRADEVSSAIGYVADVLARRLRRKGLAGHTVTLKISYAWGNTRTARKPVVHPTCDEHEIAAAARDLLPQLWHEGEHVRLLGIGVSGFGEGPAEQLSLFDDTDDLQADRERAATLAQTSDALRERFGPAALMYGSELKFRDEVSNTQPLDKDADEP